MHATPVPIVLLVVFVVFLGVLAGMAVAVTRTVNPDGRVSRGFFGALGSSLTLLFLCGLGLVGTGLFAASLAVGTALERNPIRRIEVHREGAHPEHHQASDEWLQADGDPYEGYGLDHARYSDGEDVHLLFTVDAGAGAELLALMEDVLGIDRHALGKHMTVTHHQGAGGDSFEVYEFRLGLDDDDLADLERQLGHDLGGVDVDLPDGVAIDLRSAATR